MDYGQKYYQCLKENRRLAVDVWSGFPFYALDLQDNYACEKADVLGKDQPVEPQRDDVFQRQYRVASEYQNFVGCRIEKRT